MTLRVGVIADDFTGATDIASSLVGAGLQTVQLNNPTEAPKDLNAEAIVLSLKTRSIAAEDAVEQSLAALQLLQHLDAERIVFKYCSTFDSTSEGNIGPVIDALMDALGEKIAVVAPALPINGRTVYQGNLFVHEKPLAESSMRDHPVTPMRDSNLLRLMDAQGSGCSALIPYDVVESGPHAVREALRRAQDSGARYAVIDALNEAHLDTIGAASVARRLVTGGSGVGAGVARALSGKADTEVSRPAATWQFNPGPTVVISGSASWMTNAQVAAYRKIARHRGLDIPRLLDDEETYLVETRDWALNHLSGLGPLIYATAPSRRVQQLQQRYGAQELPKTIERFFGRLAVALKEQGISRFITAGGETSGAVTQALGVDGFEVGPQIAPGVPWVRSLDGHLDLALKSGNFGDENFFRAAQALTKNHR